MNTETKPSVKRSELVARVYVSKSGEAHKLMPEDGAVERVEYRFTDGTVEAFDAAALPKALHRAALLTGIGYILSASMNKATTPAEAIEAWQARRDVLLSGKWTDRPEGTGQPRDSAIVEAIFAYASETGRTIDYDKVRAHMLAEDVDDGSKSEANVEAVRAARGKRREQWVLNADVKRHYERIKAERQAAKAAREAAKGGASAAGSDVDTLFGSIA